MTVVREAGFLSTGTPEIMYALADHARPHRKALELVRRLSGQKNGHEPLL